MPFGMTDKGFVPKRLADVLDSLHEKITNVTDPQTGAKIFQNEEDDSILMQFADILAEEISTCWEEAYLAANQFDPLNSSGVALRGLIQLNGLTSSTGTSTVLNMELGGTPGVVVPQGSLVSDTPGKDVYEIVNSVTIGTEGTVNALARAQEKGAKEPAVNTVISIQSPIYGWNSAKNVSISSVGSEPDTDRELHIKQERATSATSYRQVDAIYSGIINIPGVTFARIYVNPTMNTDSRGITAKTIAPVVVGGDNDQIANVIRLKADALANFQGNTSVSYTGTWGEVQTIKFTRPQEKPVYVDVDITITNSDIWPDNGEQQMREAIVKYSQYNNEGSAGFAPGENVVISRLYTPINSVPGFKVNSIKIGFSSSTSTSDLTIAWNEISKFEEELINIVKH